MRGILRRVLSWVLLGAFGTIALAVFGEWFIEVARDKGWYDNAGQTWDRLVSAVLTFVSSPPVLIGLSLLTGLVGGLWLDQLLLKKERMPSDAETQSREGSLNEGLAAVYKSLGLAIGSTSALQFDMTRSEIEPLFLLLRRNEGIEVPDLYQDDAEAGIRRALLFLNYVSPAFRLSDFDEARKRAQLIVPQLAALDIYELRSRTKY